MSRFKTTIISWFHLAALDFFPIDYILGNDRVHSFPSLAVDNSAGSFKGNVYVVYAHNGNHDGADIAFQRSGNGGITFTLPILLNSRPGNDRAQWFPWITVDKNTGRVWVFYLDQGIATSGDLTEVSYLYSDDGGATWSKPVPMTDRPFHAGHGNDTGQPNLGDYNQIVAQNGELFAVFGATTPVGFADGQPNTSFTTPDAFFKRIAASTVRPSLRLGAVTFSDSNGDGFIGRLESVSFTLPLQNYVSNTLSAGSVTSISAILSTTTAGVSVIQKSSSYPDLAPGAAANNSSSYVLQFSPAFVPGTPVGLALNVTSTQGSLSLYYTQTTGVPLATTIYSETFDAVAPGNLPAGWSTTHVGGIGTVPWTTSNSFCSASSNGLFHVNANDGLRFERVASPNIVVPGDAEYVTLDFDVCYDTEDDPAFNILAYDGAVLRIADLTAGRTARSELVEAFEQEFTTGAIQHYPKHFPRSNNTSYFQDMSAWAGDSGGFRHVHLRLPGMAGSTVQLRFEYTQDAADTCTTVRPTHTGCGVLVDNIVMNSVVSFNSPVNTTLLPLITR